jgi:hypothetical protein
MGSLVPQGNTPLHQVLEMYLREKPDEQESNTQNAAESLRRGFAERELIASIYDGNHECELSADLWQVRSAEDVCPLAVAFWSNELRHCGAQYDGLTAYVNTASLQKWLKGERKRGGRPASYDWSAFEAEAISVLEDRGDFSPALEPTWRQSSLEAYMAEWCREQCGKEPSETQVRKHVQTALEKFRRSREVGN